MLALMFILLFVGRNFAQTPGLGSCPDVTTISPFNTSQYVGLWYENRRSVPIFFEFTGKCVTANYSANNDGSIKVVNRQISWVTGKESSIEGPAVEDTEKCGNKTGCGKLIVTFPTPVLGNVHGSYWILDTDYKSYAVVYSCTDVLFNHVTFLWILTRERNPSKDVLDKAETVLKNNGIANIYTAHTDQENCP